MAQNQNVEILQPANLQCKFDCLSHRMKLDESPLLSAEAALNEAIDAVNDVIEADAPGADTATALQDLRRNVFGGGGTGGNGGPGMSPATQKVPDHVPDLPVLLLTKQPLFPLFSRVIEVGHHT